jgi:hypothetical protein
MSLLAMTTAVAGPYTLDTVTGHCKTRLNTKGKQELPQSTSVLHERTAHNNNNNNNLLMVILDCKKRSGSRFSA